MEHEGKVQYESFNIFLKGLQFNSPYNISPRAFKYSMQENLHYLKKEILDNLIILSENQRRPYLNRLKYDIEYHKKFAFVTLEDLEKWYKKYGTVKEDDSAFDKYDNPIFQIIDSEPPTLRDMDEEEYNFDTENIQNDFFNYYYGSFINAAIEFINTQLHEIEPHINKKIEIPNQDADATVSEAITINNDVTEAVNDNTKETVEKHIKCFKGSKKGHGKIITDKEYDRLLNYTIYLINEDKLPKNIKPIPKIALSNEFIRYTFYRLHSELNGRKIKDSWIDFIHAVFTQFANTSKQTTKTKFSQYNKNGSYENDKAGITDYT